MGRVRTHLLVALLVVSAVLVLAWAGEAPAAPAQPPSGLDSDGDGLLDDGDGSGDFEDAPCATGQTSGCDDNCRYEPNPGQEDRGGLHGADSDGIGDACQCGDVVGTGGVPDGAVDVSDLLRYRRYFAGQPGPGTFPARRCSINGASGPGLCDGSDLLVMRRLLAGQAAPFSQDCEAARVQVPGLVGAEGDDETLDAVFDLAGIHGPDSYAPYSEFFFSSEPGGDYATGHDGNPCTAAAPCASLSRLLEVCGSGSFVICTIDAGETLVVDDAEPTIANPDDAFDPQCPSHDDLCIWIRSSDPAQRAALSAEGALFSGDPQLFGIGIGGPPASRGWVAFTNVDVFVPASVPMTIDVLDHMNTGLFMLNSDVTYLRPGSEAGHAFETTATGGESNSGMLLLNVSARSTDSSVFNWRPGTWGVSVGLGTLERRVETDGLADEKPTINLGDGEYVLIGHEVTGSSAPGVTPATLNAIAASATGTQSQRVTTARLVVRDLVVPGPEDGPVERVGRAWRGSYAGSAPGGAVRHYQMTVRNVERGFTQGGTIADDGSNVFELRGVLVQDTDGADGHAPAMIEIAGSTYQQLASIVLDRVLLQWDLADPEFWSPGAANRFGTHAEMQAGVDPSVPGYPWCPTSPHCASDLTGVIELEESQLSDEGDGLSCDPARACAGGFEDPYVIPMPEGMPGGEWPAWILGRPLRSLRLNGPGGNIGAR